MRKVRLTESQLHQIIKESVKNILSEMDWTLLGRAAVKSDRSNKLAKMALNGKNLSDDDYDSIYYPSKRKVSSSLYGNPNEKVSNDDIEQWERNRGNKFRNASNAAFKQSHSSSRVKLSPFGTDYEIPDDITDKDKEDILSQNNEIQNFRKINHIR